MKKFLLLFVMNALLVTSFVFGQTPTLTDVIVPQYMQGMNGANNTRTPYAFRVTISGLTPSVTYRYYNQVVTSAELPTANGAGNVAFVNYNGDFTMTSSCDLSKAGGYSTFTTDATGSYTGWFMTIPTSNAARFTPGNHLFCRIMLNDGGSGTTVATRLTTSDSVTVVNYGTTAPGAANEGTGIYGVSGTTDKDFVFLYDNEAGTGRPLAGAVLENDGLTLPSTTPAFYTANVEGKTGAWGTIVPNILPNGIRRIERRALLTAAITASSTSADGVWSGVSTVNPTAGVAAIQITEPTLPVEMTSFSASVKQGNVSLKWTTATETNNYGFEVQRSSKNNSWEKIGFVKGSLTSTVSHEYGFTDNNAKTGSYFYRLKQLDMSGAFEYSDAVEASLAAPKEFSLSQNYPNPFNPVTAIKYQLPQSARVTLKIYNAIGSEVATLVNEIKDAGSYSAVFDASKMTSGIYFYKLMAGKSSITKKMILLK
jgi:hypothetical protein